jgi:hypothetical protein
MKFLIILTLFLNFKTWAQDAKNPALNFEALKDVLKKDGLENEAKVQEKIEEVKKVEVKNIELERSNYPTSDDFWGFISEYWLVKNAVELKWDYQKPDYGLNVALANFLENVGYFKKKFKILLLDTTTVTHMGIPSDKDEYIILISVPFIRSMDLSKLEISLLCFENILRLEMNYFKTNLALSDEDLSFLGKNFHETGIDLKKVELILNRFNEVVYKKGFSFQQQFEVTKKIDQILKGTPSLWSQYIKLLNKIDKLIRSDLLYSEYNKIYPSPEMQIQWLSPNSKQD